MLFKNTSALATASLLTATLTATLAPWAWATGPITGPVTGPLACAVSADPLAYNVNYSIQDYSGRTYFTMLKDTIKPSLDAFAKKGFVVASAATVKTVLQNVSPKVKSQALTAAGSEDNLYKIVNALAASSGGKQITFYDLPALIAATKIPCDRFGLTTFLALASGGGTAIHIDSKNIFYNVNYGAGDAAKDEMTGRSFAADGLHSADDVSDKNYLASVQKLVQDPKEDLDMFYTELMQVLTNCDVSNFSKLSPAGQSVLSDFLAIYTAEGTRHLMSDLKTHAWDQALLEVTLLSAFHAGQKDLMVMYNGQLTDTVPQQAPGGSPRTEMRKAAMIDWWQFSSNADPKFRNRSGINVTKNDFTRLGGLISDYMRAHHSGLVSKVEAEMTGIKTGANVFEEIPLFLINFKTAPSLTDSARFLTRDVTQFLSVVRSEADQITAVILASQVAAAKSAPPATAAQ